MPNSVSHPDEVVVLKRRFGQGAADIDKYLELDGYKATQLAIEKGPDWIINEMKASGLRGRGGAGFPTGLKWSFVPKQSAKPKYVLVNGDESEPGTCKDHILFLDDPHAMIEGTIIAGLAIGAKMGFIYLRGEYRYLLKIMEKAVADAYAKGFLGKNIFGKDGVDFDIVTQTGAGAYEVGEESALMESLEGKRGVPRIKPPFPAVVGLYGGPTVINNAETIASVPHILLMGGEAYAKLGTERNGGTRLFGISGHVNKPGVYELPMGYSLRKAIYDVAGGIKDGKQLKAVVPGGSSCPVLKADEIDVGLDFDQMAKAGTMLGSGGIVVLDETVSIVEFAMRVINFYQHESCGWCIPCREGTDWLKKTLTRFHAGGGNKKDIDNIQYLAENMMGRTFCPLGDAAAMPTLGFVKKFRSEFEEYLEGKRTEPLLIQIQPVGEPELAGAHLIVKQPRTDRGSMMRWSQAMRYAGLAALCLPIAAHAQFTSQAPVGVLKNLSLLKPPSNSKVAIVVFEDLGCPHCAAAHPIELQAAAETHVPIERYDMPIPSHVWTFEGAVCARYIQDRISAQLANQFRTDLFAAQMRIASKEDVLQFTQSWLQRHGQRMPFVMDSDGSLAKQVNADVDLGTKLNIGWTPTIVVVTDHKQQVICGANAEGGDPREIAPVVEAALAQVQSQPHTNRHSEATR